jgi:hypothetical protein
MELLHTRYSKSNKETKGWKCLWQLSGERERSVPLHSVADWAAYIAGTV